MTESHIKPETINLISLGTLTQIGPATKTLNGQPVIIFFFSVKHQLAGNQSNKQQLPFHPLGLNTWQQRKPLKKPYGCKNY